MSPVSPILQWLPLPQVIRKRVPLWRTLRISSELLLKRHLLFPIIAPFTLKSVLVWVMIYTLTYVHTPFLQGLLSNRASLVQMVKNLPAVRKTWVQPPSQEDHLEKKMATHSSILAWRIPWAEEPGRLQSMGSQRIEHNWATNTFIPTRPIYQQVSKWQRLLHIFLWAIFPQPRISFILPDTSFNISSSRKAFPEFSSSLIKIRQPTQPELLWNCLRSFWKYRFLDHLMPGGVEPRKSVCPA